MGDTATFTLAAAQKLATAAKIVLGEPVNQGGRAETRRAIPARNEFFAIINGHAANGSSTTSYRYAWNEQTRTVDGWANLTGGRSGTTTDGYALSDAEAGVGTAPIAIGEIVLIRLDFYTDGSDSSVPAYSIVTGETTGTGSKYQVYSIIDDAGTKAFDWVRAH